MEEQKIMKSDIAKLSVEQLQAKISMLEDAYAECFGNEERSDILNSIRNSIMELKHEIDKRLSD